MINPVIAINKVFCRNNKKFLLMLFSVLFFSCSNIQSQMINKSTVRNLELKRYLGTWYEIARFQHKFEKDLVGVTATYNLLDNGKIEVINKGYKYNLDGEKSVAIGKAKIPDFAEPGKFKVSFFWIFYADYNVLELDTNYKWALIGSSSSKYLWILSRTPKLDNNVYEFILSKAKERGYDLSQLYKVPQGFD